MSNGNATVITYQLAYAQPSKVTLCARHTETYEYPLGPVQYGRHFGFCDECSREIAEGNENAREVSRKARGEA